MGYTDDDRYWRASGTAVQQLPPPAEPIVSGNTYIGPTSAGGIAMCGAGVAMLMAIAFGCGQAMKGNPQNPPQLIEATKTAEVVHERLSEPPPLLRKASDDIDSNVGRVAARVPAKDASIISPWLTSISLGTAVVRTQATEIEKTQAYVVDLQREIAVAKAAHERFAADAAKRQQQGDAKIAKLEAANRDSLRKLMGAMIVSSVLGLGVSVALFYLGNKMGIASGIISGVVLVASIVVGWYATWIALFAGAATLIGVVMLIRKIVIERRATTELVQTVEVAKQAMSPSARVEVFGDGAVTGEVDMQQNDTTKALVKQARGKAKTPAVKLAKTAA